METQLEVLTPGERAAYAQGKDIITNEQMAVCYVCAKNRLLDKDTTFKGIGNDIALEAGMNQETFRRTCNKFELILSDRHDDPEYIKGEVIYAKILKAHEKYSEMSNQELMDLAYGSFTEENRMLGRELKDLADARTKKYSAAKKIEDGQLKFKLMDLYNAFKKAGYDGIDAKAKAIKKLATETGKDPIEFTKIWNLIHK